MELNHISYEGKIKKILKKSECGCMFDGIFTLAEDRSADNKNDFITYFEVEDDLIADEGDCDLDYEKTMTFLKSSYPDLTEEELNILYSLTAGDEDIRDFVEESVNIPFLPEKYKREYDSIDEALFHIDGCVLGDISLECQNIRGLIAKDQGYSAIAMSDEFGTSYLIMADTKYEIIEED